MSFVAMLISTTILAGCAPGPTPTSISQKTNLELSQLLEAFEYANNDVQSYSFPEIIDEIEKRGASASETAPVLGRAIAFNLRDSVIASNALLAIGPLAKSSIPYLLQNLDNSREDVRRYSVFVLGILGEPASCAVPKISVLLWDSDPYVRSTSAGALTEITGTNLVKYDDLRLDPSIPGNVNPDDPEGSISTIAREWWLTTGQNMTWPTEMCEPLPQ